LTELRPSEITLMNRVDQSQSLTGVRKMGFICRMMGFLCRPQTLTHTNPQHSNFLKSAIQSMADLKTIL
jgi:hypothetical protein